MEMIFGSLIQTQIEVKLHFTSQKPTALRQFKIKDSFTTIKVVIETLIKNQVSAYWHSSLLRLESQQLQMVVNSGSHHHRHQPSSVMNELNLN